MDQHIAGYHVRDSLETVLEEAKGDNPDFELYRRQQWCVVNQHNCNKLGDPASEGWSLDKCKNVHMAEKTYRMKPNYNWYVFVDADTYVLWPNLVQWLGKLRPTTKHYSRQASPCSTTLASATAGRGTWSARPRWKHSPAKNRRGQPVRSPRQEGVLRRLCARGSHARGREWSKVQNVVSRHALYTLRVFSSPFLQKRFPPALRGIEPGTRHPCLAHAGGRFFLAAWKHFFRLITPCDSGPPSTERSPRPSLRPVALVPPDRDDAPHGQRRDQRVLGVSSASATAPRTCPPPPKTLLIKDIFYHEFFGPNPQKTRRIWDNLADNRSSTSISTTPATEDWKKDRVRDTNKWAQRVSVRRPTSPSRACGAMCESLSQRGVLLVPLQRWRMLHQQCIHAGSAREGALRGREADP